jgi:hypothetical protein
MSLGPDCFPTDPCVLRAARQQAASPRPIRLPAKIAVAAIFGTKYWHSRHKNARWVHFCRKFTFERNYVIEICQHG